MSDPLILDNICEFIIDTKHKTPKFTKSGYPCIRTPNIGRGYFILGNAKYVDEASYIEWTTRATPSENDLILAREAPVGNVAIIPPNLKVCHGQRTVLIRPDNNKVNPNYLMYLMLGDEVQAKMHSMASGATVAHLNMSDIRALKIPELPDVHEQKKIAGILKAYDNLIENNNRRIAILEDMAQSLYKEWFVKFRFHGHKNTKFKETSLGLIPEGWEVKSLKDVCNLTMGQSPKSEFYNEKGEGMPFFQGVRDYGARFPVERVWCTKPTRYAKKNDILFSVRAPVGRLNIAGFDLAIGRGLCAINHKDGFQSFLFQQLKSIFTSEDMMGNGAIFNSVTKSDMEGIKLISSCKEITKSVENKLNSIFRSLDLLSLKNSNLKQQRDLLLPKLISGKLEL